MIKTYDCGLRLINNYDKDKKIAKVAIYVATGSGFDLKGKEGIAHFYEHMFFKSTPTFKTKELLDTLSRFGGYYNASTGHDITNYFGKVVVDEAHEFAKVLSECFFNGIYDTKEMETEKGVVFSEIDMYDDDFSNCCREALDKEFFKGTDFSHPVLGSKQSVGAITADDLRHYRTQNNCASNVIVVFSGGVDDDSADKIVQEFFLPHFSGNATPTVYAKMPVFAPELKEHCVFTQKDTEQVYFDMAVPTIRREDPLFDKLSFASTIFGGGLSSRLSTRMREKEGIVYSIGSYVCTNAIAGNFWIDFSTNKTSAKKAVLALKDEINKFLDSGFTDDEIALAKKMQKTQVLLAYDDIINMQYATASSVIRTGKPFDIEEYLQKIDSFTKTEINDAFAKVLLDKNFLVSTVAKENDLDVLNLLK